MELSNDMIQPSPLKQHVLNTRLNIEGGRGAINEINLNSPKDLNRVSVSPRSLKSEQIPSTVKKDKKITKK